MFPRLQEYIFMGGVRIFALFKTIKKDAPATTGTSGKTRLLINSPPKCSPWNILGIYY